MERSIRPFPSDKGLEILLDCKFTFTVYSSYFSQSLKTLSLILYMTFSSSAIDVLVSFYNALVRSKLDYDSVAWNFIIVTGSYKLEIKANL
jgi:hypothetical protein